MPPRLNKRQLRELEELQHLEATGSPASEQVEEEEEEEPSDRGVTSGFAAVSPLNIGRNIMLSTLELS